MPTALVSTQELAVRPEWRVFDCRHDLMKPELGAQQYREAHIPGALFAQMDRDLSGPKGGGNGRHPLPDPAAFIDWLGRQGVKPADQVVCYDAGNGTVAARLWWMLRWIGHEQAAVLDGGLAQWLKEGRPVTAEVPRVAPATYPGRARPEMLVDVAFIEKNGHRLLVDARAPVRFRGEQEPIDPVAGHIPGARNRFCNDNVTPEGVFKPSALLKKEFAEILGSTSPTGVVNYCGSGVSACHNLLAMEVAGLQGAKLYPGSWSEWIVDPARPVAKAAG
jgi:thiosulfate/3-mercaptopyruvate sulfurtransferase